MIRDMDTMHRDGMLRQILTSRAGKNGSALSMVRCASLGFARRVRVWRETGAERKSTRRDQTRRRKKKEGGEEEGAKARWRGWVMKSPRMTHYRIPRVISIGVGSGSKSEDDSPQHFNAYGQDE